MTYRLDPLRDAQEYFLNSCLDIADALAERHHPRWEDIYYKWSAVVDLSSEPDTLINWADTLMSRLPHVPADPINFNFNQYTSHATQRASFAMPSTSHSAYYPLKHNNSLAVDLLSALIQNPKVALTAVGAMILLVLLIVL